MPQQVYFDDCSLKHDIFGFEHMSAFTPVQKLQKPKSFIQIRDIKRKPDLVSGASSSDPLSGSEVKHDHEDSDSTHHSGKSKMMIKEKLSKEEKRNRCFKSIKNLIESRRMDTISSLESISSEDEIVLRSSPKKPSKNPKLSHFRGVSNNGRKWQVMIMGFAKKIYFGGIESELEASQKYDKYAILMHGLEAKTNYNYSKSELLQILHSKIDEI